MLTSNTHHLLIGCSFTDPTWQSAIPWSVQYSKKYPSYIVAKAGMGIKGICTEALHYLKNLKDIKKVIIVLPTLWRYDIEVDREYYTSDAIVDLLHANDGNVDLSLKSDRKWLISGGLNFEKNKNTHTSLFKTLYKTQGLLVIAKEHFFALSRLIEYCKYQGIEIHISSISDLKNGFQGIEYIHQEVFDMLDNLGYPNWMKFDGNFIGEFLGHHKHPSTEEHQILCDYILKQTE